MGIVRALVVVHLLINGFMRPLFSKINLKENPISTVNTGPHPKVSWAIATFIPSFYIVIESLIAGAKRLSIVHFLKKR